MTPPTKASFGPSGRDLLEGIDLLILDKDGTLIDFHLMWGDWLADLAARLERATGLALSADLHALMGVDPDSGLVDTHGILAATPMARIHDAVVDLLLGRGLDRATTDRAMARAWRPPDPVRLARPLADLPRLLTTLRRRVRHLAIATSDDRAPTQRTLEALGIAGLIDAVACADDGHASKPSPEAVLVLCRALGVAPDRTAVVGDASADLWMGRAAKVARVIGVLSGVGDAATLRPLADVLLRSIADLAAPESGDRAPIG